MKIFDLSLPIGIKIPEFGFPYQENSDVLYLVVSRTGSSYRVHAKGDNYSKAVDIAADYCIKYHKKFFVVMVTSQVRVL